MRANLTGCRFEPCEWSDLSCHALVDIAAVSGTPLRGIVGHHKNAGTWLKGYGEAEPSPLALRLQLRLSRNSWPTLVRSSQAEPMAEHVCMPIMPCFPGTLWAMAMRSPAHWRCASAATPGPPWCAVSKSQSHRRGILHAFQALRLMSARLLK